MELKRKPLQGITNIVKFNWHFYLVAGLILGLLNLLINYLPSSFQTIVLVLSLFAIFSILFSLLISYYVYDVSNLYSLDYMDDMTNKKVLNVNAGFDETSGILKSKFPEIELTICDFYDPQKHTEVSIKRARKSYPPSIETIRVSTTLLPFSDNTFDYALAILSTHEIRDEKERIQFFKEVKRVTKAKGTIYVTEHLRDLANFSAYTIGAFHFYSKSTWLNTFKEAQITVIQEIKTTPFISTFILKNNGDTP